jgi:hypothetical protein
VTVYSVYEPSAQPADSALRADRLAFVKEGFSWIALLVPALWLIFYRMWIELIVFVLGFAALQWAFGTSEQGQRLFGWVSFALCVLFAFEANDLRSAALERRGYRLVGVAGGGGGRRTHPPPPPPPSRAILLSDLACRAGETNSHHRART